MLALWKRASLRSQLVAIMMVLLTGAIFLMAAATVTLGARAVALDEDVVGAGAPGDLHGVPARLLGDVGDRGVAAADQRRGRRVERGRIGAHSPDALLAGGRAHRQSGRGALGARSDHVTGTPTVLHLEGEDNTGPTVSHGLEWPVPGDQVINDPEAADA